MDDGRLERTGSLVCLRRSPPVWWAALAAGNEGRRLEHAPIPPSRSPHCEGALRELIERRLPRLPDPLVIFCKEGRHRSGIVVAVLARQNGASLEDAIQAYVDGAGYDPRPREIKLIQKLCRTG